MPEAFSKTLQGAPFRGAKYRRSLMDHTVEGILKQRGISFTRGTLEVKRVIRSVSLLASGPAEQQGASPRHTITREVIIAMTIEIAKAHKQVYGDVRALHPDSLMRIASGLAGIVRDEGHYPVTWHDDHPVNWPNELALYEREHSSRKS